MIVLDTGALYAALDANETLHGRAVAALTAATPPRVISPFVLAELDYLVGSRVGHKAQMARHFAASAANRSGCCR